MTDEKRLTKNENIKKSMRETCLRRMSQTCKVYTVKIDESRLSNRQAEQLKMLFVEAKWIYNDILNYSENNDILTYNTKVKSVDVLNKNKEKEVRELKFIGSQMKQSVFANILSNIKMLSTKKKQGNKVGKLKYISEYKSLNLKQYGNTYKIYGNKRIKIQNVSGKIIVNGLEQFINIPDIEIANAKILNKPDGYYIAITTYQYTDKLPVKEYIGEEIGIDFGIKDSITLSTGKKFKASIGETERLKRLQRKLARQQKGSNNRYKTRILIQKEYQKITNKKNDIANKLVSYILSYEHIYMQDENITGWQKGLFGKQVQYSILGRIKMKLINNPRVEVLDRFVPTTKYCPNCGTIKNDIDLSDRVYHCDICGYTNDRDIHSANNMIIMTKKIINLPCDSLVNLPTEHREVKPVENELSFDEAGRFHSKEWN